MVDRHRQHSVNRELLLVGPGQKVPEVLYARSRHFGSEKATRRGVGVDMREAEVASHDPTAPLIFEAHFARYDRTALRELLEARADDGELRVREGDLEQGAPRSGLDVWVARRIVARDVPFVDGLVQERCAMARVPSDEHGRDPAL